MMHVILRVINLTLEHKFFIVLLHLSETNKVYFQSKTDLRNSYHFTIDQKYASSSTTV